MTESTEEPRYSEEKRAGDRPSVYFPKRGIAIALPYVKLSESVVGLRSSPYGHVWTVGLRKEAYIVC
jgi:hypothetical protein